MSDDLTGRLTTARFVNIRIPLLYYSFAHSAGHRHFFISLHILYVYVTIQLLES